MSDNSLKKYYTVDTRNRPTVLIKTCGKDKQCKDKEHQQISHTGNMHNWGKMRELCPKDWLYRGTYKDYSVGIRIRRVKRLSE